MTKRLFFILLAYSLALFAALFLAEVYFRYFAQEHLPAPVTVRAVTLEYVPALYARHVFPQHEQNVKNSTISGISSWHINSRGYRGADFSIPKAPQTTRLVFYGGSAVFDPRRSDPGGDWPHQTETFLRKKGHADVEVVNAGIPGHASFDSFGRFFSEGIHLEPDAVLFCHAWNDIKKFRSGESLLRSMKPQRQDNDPRLYARNGLDRFFCNHSQLYLHLRKVHYDKSLGAGPEGQKPEEAVVSKLNDKALEQYRLTVESFVDMARNMGAVPVLMTQARLPVYNLSETLQEKIRYDYVLLTHEMLVQAFDACDEIVREVAKEKQTGLIDASAIMSGHSEYFVDHVHLSAQGSEALAQLTAEYFHREYYNIQ